MELAAGAVAGFSAVPFRFVVDGHMVSGGWESSDDVIGQRSLLIVAIGLTTTLALVGCSGTAGPAPPRAERTPAGSPAATAGPPETVVASGANRACRDGRLVLGDLSLIDAQWVAGVQAAIAKGLAWRADARLIRLRVGCGVLEPSYRWQGMFYSESAQSFFLSDTGEQDPAEVDASAVATLPTGALSFVGLQNALARAGYSDDTLISASSGIDIRLNTDAEPFGPPSAPKNLVYYHVALDDQGVIRDLFVSADDWIIYLY
jgi:hypothetical protein